MLLWQALNQLRPGSQWYETNGVITWLDTTQTRPTDDEIKACMDAYVPPLSVQDQIATLQAQVQTLLAAQRKQP